MILIHASAACAVERTVGSLLPEMKQLNKD